MKRILLWTLLIAFCLSAVLGIVLFLFGLTFTETEGKILATTILLGIYSIAGFCQSFIVENRRANKYLSFAGFLITGLSYLSLTLLIWFSNYVPSGSGTFKAVVIGVLFTVFGTHASLMSLIEPKNRMTTRAQTGTIVTSLLATLVTDYAILFNPNTSFPLLYRWIAVLIILTVLGTLVTPILHKLTNQRGDS